MTGVKNTSVYFETVCSDILTNKSWQPGNKEIFFFKKSINIIKKRLFWIEIELLPKMT